MLPMYCILLLVSILEKSWMEGCGYVGASSSSTTATSGAARTQPVVEMVGPRNFVALGGNDLRIGYRLPPTSLSSEPTPTLSPREDLSIQLTLSGEDGDESWIATQKLPGPLKSSWQEVRFDCGLIVRGGYYNIRLIGGTEDEDEGRTVEIISNLTIQTLYPTIDFEVPHRLETYTTSVPVSFGLTKALVCKPKLPLPSTTLTLSVCKQPDKKECFREFATIMEDPLLRLEREGRVTVMIGCHLWGRNSSYRLQIQEKPSIRNVIATSHSIKVDWSPEFGITFNRTSIIPCRGSVQAVVSYPACILPGKDKIRVYGYESLPVPSFLAPKRFNYILEEQILPDQQRITFPCSIFPQRFSRYCFQYINTAEDDSVAIVVENCIPTFPLETFSDGGWGSWSAWSPCSTTCGKGGKRFRWRFCDSPSPSFGANVCQGNFIEEEACDKLPECPLQPASPIPSPGEEDDEEEDYDDETRRTGTRTRQKFLNGNLQSTQDCECGCLLNDRVPGINYSLSVALPANQSSCADQDEEEHHNLKWVLQASGEENRIRFYIVEADVGCVTLSFRDGNTTDSNLLEVIRTPMSTAAGDEGKGKRRRQRRNVLHSVESTGASLSIAAAESSQNCSAPFLYFIASYRIVPHSNNRRGFSKVSLIEWNAYEFWTFIFLKLILTFFIIIVLCSTFGGCATKVYRKYKYKELKWGDGEEEDDELMDAGERHVYTQPLDGVMGVEAAEAGGGGSRNTSITLMSFDYAYWKQMQTLRLKYFLMRPRVLNWRTSRVRSFPTSPLSGKPGSAAYIKRKKLNPPTSKSESELMLGNPQMKEDEEGGRKRMKTNGMVGRGLSNCECIYRRVKGKVMRKEQQGFNTSSNDGDNGEDDEEQQSFNPLTTTKSRASERRKDKLWKEQENLLKRKESDQRRKKRRERRGTETEKVAIGIRCESESELSCSNSDPQIERRDKKLEKSGSSSFPRLSDSPSSRSPCMGERGDDFDGELDFEMDYYDYNVVNAGNIPGSLLGMEPAFVLWNSEMLGGGVEENPPFPDESESFEMETPSTSASLAALLHPSQGRKYNHHHQPQRLLITKETSLDTLKFVDEEEEDGLEDDDSATHVSDSIFDNEV